MSTAKLSHKGQLVIPSRFRTALHLQPGDQVSFCLEGDRLVISRSTPSKARLVENRKGRKVLIAPADAPPMTTESVKAILADITDAYLVTLAKAHDCKLATLDDALCTKAWAKDVAVNPLPRSTRSRTD